MSGVQCEFDSQSISCFIRRLELILVILFMISLEAHDKAQSTEIFLFLGENLKEL